MATKKTKNIGYVEPADFFPKSIRKKAKIGEFGEKDKAAKDAAPKKTTKPPKKKAAPKKKRG